MKFKQLNKGKLALSRMQLHSRCREEVAFQCLEERAREKQRSCLVWQ